MVTISASCSPEEVKYQNNELLPVNGSVYPHLALIAVQIIALNVASSPGQRKFFASAVAGIAIAAQLSRFSQDVATANLFALAWPHYLSTLELLLFSGPKGPAGDLWRLDKPAHEAMSFSAFSLQKIKWAILLLLNLRGVDWSHQIRSMPKQGSRYGSRARFLIGQCIELFGVYLMADLVSQLSIRLNFTAPDGTVGTLNSKCITLRDPDLIWGFLKALVYGAGPYYFINFQYIICSIFAVGLGFSQPKDWPPLFGKLAEVTTVRHFWGSFWQQMMRRFFTTYNRSFIEWLGFRRGTNASSYGQLFFSFFISGIFHFLSLLQMPTPANITLFERTAGIMYYFLWQAVAITMEDFVQWLWKQNFGSERRWWFSIVGYVWVICSFWFALPWAGDVMMRVRMGEVSPLPSVFAPLAAQIPLRYNHLS